MRNTASELSMACPPSMPISDAIFPPRKMRSTSSAVLRDFEHVRVAAGDLVHRVDLLQRGRHRAAPVEARRDVDGPELRPEPAGAQARDVRLQLRLGGADVHLVEVVAHVLAQFPCEVVVAVHQRNGAHQRPRAIEQRRRGLLTVQSHGGHQHEQRAGARADQPQTHGDVPHRNACRG